MKWIIGAVFIVSLVGATELELQGNGTKCEACLEFFEVLDGLCQSNISNDYYFFQNIEFACKILSANGDNDEVEGVCKFMKANGRSVYSYIRYTDHGIIKPAKDCWMFFRCPKPEASSILILSLLTQEDEGEPEDILEGLRRRFKF